ncbi:cytochrome b5-like heme/steroid binding domain-containing protein [Catenaria anguillulae PL171]|uniref:Cytochrome b5-like heme/steroid binding domain-containing protein n=1 Tax=Catenaria anguillulae PL171 TaxID=765915 RepID=A0A1Y2HZS9_9FUNG|nr:cytochrome b5-like heme/steroid binding domain-containing protein [Catenaria anguillulae PL171]
MSPSPHPTHIARKLMDTLAANPLNVFLAAAVAYSAWRLWTSGSRISSDHDADARRSALPKADEPIVLRNYTPKELAKFDGKQSERIMMAVRGHVFDVTRGAGFYGPGSPYGNFAGRDASRGLAKHSFETKYITPLDQPIDDLKDLSAMERETLDDWFGMFSSKYDHVGFLVPEGQE